MTKGNQVIYKIWGDYMAKPRWMITRKGRTYDGEELTIIEVYKPNENKEIVKKENKRWTHKRELIRP